MSEKSQQRRLQHQVDGAELREMVNKKEVKTVQEMVKLIMDGDRELQTKPCAAESLPNRFAEMYEMVTAVEQETTAGQQDVTDNDILSAQGVDMHCKQMVKLLQGSKVRIGSEALYVHTVQMASSLPCGVRRWITEEAHMETGQQGIAASPGRQSTCSGARGCDQATAEAVQTAAC